MPYVDRQNRSCGFLDIEENENSNKFQRRYFILDTQNNLLIWYMDNPQNLPSGANAVGSLPLTYVSKVSEATAKQKPKAEFCFVINALSRRYFLQANDLVDLKEWVIALNNATKITVPKVSNAQPKSEVPKSTAEHQPKRQQAYKTEIIGGVVVHTPIYQNEGEDNDPGDAGLRTHVRGLPSSVAVTKPGVVRWGFCVKQGNVRKSWKRRFFTLDDSSVSYYKCDTDKEPLRAIPLKDILKVHECFVKSGDLLLRDNLFEIVTSARIFYIQTDTPEDMHAWIKAISSKIQELQGPVKESLFSRSTSLHRGNKPPSSGPRRRQAGAEERKTPLTKSCSVAPSWQPWTPVNAASSELLTVEEGETVFSSLPPLPAGPEKDLDPTGARRRHRSQPQANTDKVFPFNIDDDGIRTTDV
ncbi:pleckstrin homology domain-containing family A member 2 [Paramormyrops kingsleyae]|uniref:Pleckstrin homology domain containing A2 n=1 Tax=Paramormyrops kingsleyae TaxID=1676925 RepID=A0A3B3R3P1_9TELE|nr:pleckstrin homology domain-containing family A member 2 [Paramormyrops kingsleyae]